jgi:hypothetical protein
MKIREGFVSNSSSSSFVCMVTGRTEAGYDLSMRDVEMYCCENGHYFDESYLLPKPVNTPAVEYNEEEDGEESIFGDGGVEDDEDIDESDDDYRSECPANRCPICTLTHITDSDLLKYIMKSRAFNRKGIEDTMRLQFKDHKTFTEALKK